MARIIFKNCKSVHFTCPLKPNQWCPTTSSEQNRFQSTVKILRVANRVHLILTYLSSPGSCHSVPQPQWPYFPHWAQSTPDCFLLRTFTCPASPAFGGLHPVDWVKTPSDTCSLLHGLFPSLNSLITRIHLCDHMIHASPRHGFCLLRMIRHTKRSQCISADERKA